MSKSPSSKLLSEIELFLRESGMGSSYFGKAAVGNSDVVKRLRAGRDVTTNTAADLRKFMRARRAAMNPEAAE